MKEKIITITVDGASQGQWSNLLLELNLIRKAWKSYGVSMSLKAPGLKNAIEWGTRVKIRSGNGTDIDCFYLVHAERKDGEKLIVEYEGESSDDYPGDNSIYSINK